MDDEHDPDGFDQRRREAVALRFVALAAHRDRESLVASLSPIELAQHDLAAMLEVRKQYEAGETPFTVNQSNTEAMNQLCRIARPRRVVTAVAGRAL